MANEFVARKGLISSGSILVSGSVTASGFKGDGSQLTNIPSASFAISSSLAISASYVPNLYVTSSINAPSNPVPDQLWYDETTGKTYIYYVSASVGSWVLQSDPTYEAPDVLLSLQDVTDLGSTTTNAVEIQNTTNSTSTSTGALIVSGGVGVGGNVYANQFYGDGSGLTNVTAINAGIDILDEGILQDTVSSINFKSNITAVVNNNIAEINVTIPDSVYTGSYTGSFTGLLVGTSSRATTASYVLPSGLPPGTLSASSQVDITQTTGFSTFSSSLASIDASQTLRLNAIEARTGSYATTGSNTFVGNQIVSGSLTLSSSAAVELRIVGDTELTGSLRLTNGGVTSSLFGTASRAVTSSFAISASWAPSVSPTELRSGSFNGSFAGNGRQLTEITSSWMSPYINPTYVISGGDIVNNILGGYVVTMSAGYGLLNNRYISWPTTGIITANANSTIYVTDAGLVTSSLQSEETVTNAQNRLILQRTFADPVTGIYAVVESRTYNRQSPRGPLLTNNIEQFVITTGSWSGSVASDVTKATINWYFANLGLLPYVAEYPDLVRSHLNKQIEAFYDPLGGTSGSASFGVNPASWQQIHGTTWNEFYHWPYDVINANTTSSTAATASRADSHDSYAATFALLAYEYATRTADGPTWWDANYAAIDKAMYFNTWLRERFVGSGYLTSVFQDINIYPFYLTADNVEVLSAYKKIIPYAIQRGNTPSATTWENNAALLTSALRSAWSGSNSNGTLSYIFDSASNAWVPNTLTKWYPEIWVHAAPTLFDCREVFGTLVDDQYAREKRSIDILTNVAPYWHTSRQYDIFPHGFAAVALAKYGYFDMAVKWTEFLSTHIAYDSVGYYKIDNVGWAKTILNFNSELNGSQGKSFYIPIWTSATIQSSSIIYQNNGKLGIGTITPEATIEVQGNVSASSFTGSIDFSNIINVPAIISSSEQTNSGSFSGSFFGILTGSVFGTASWATSASWAPLPQGTISSSNGNFSGTFNGGVTGSLLGTASWATNALTASYVEYNNVVNKPSLVSASSQIQLNAITGTTFSNASFLFSQNLTVAGTLTAQELRTEFVTSSVIFESGSTKFGDSADDTHQFTGSLSVLGTISGSLLLPPNIVSSSTQIDYNSIQNKPTTIDTASYVEFANVANKPTLVSSSLQINTGSFTGSFTGQFIGTSSWATSASWAPIPNNTVSSSAQINTGSFTGSFTGQFIGTSSWAQTSSNLTGGTANYIPLWTSATAQSSSNLFQTGSNIGLGVTPSIWTPSWKAFQFNSQAALFAGSNTAFLGVNVYNDGSNKYIGTGEAALYRQQAGTHGWFTAPAGTANNPITFTQSLALDTNGNFGIGTTNPTSRLFVSGASSQIADFRYWSNAYVTVGDGTTSTLIGMADAGGGVPAYGIVGTLTNHNFIIRTNNTNRLFISASGLISASGPLSVGNNPYISASFNVRGPQYLPDPNLPHQVTIASTEAFNTAPVAGISFINQFQAGTDAGMGGIKVGKENTTSGDFGSYISLLNRQNGFAVSESLRITSLGNVGIGIITPGAKLHVQGNVSASSYTSSILNAVGFLGTSSWAVSASWAPITPGTISSSAQFSTGSFTGSFTGQFIGTSSWASNAISSSFAQNAQLLNNTSSAVFATTGSNTFNGNQTISGSLILSSSLPLELQVIGNVEITGSLSVTAGITGSLFGTASYALTASFIDGGFY